MANKCNWKNKGKENGKQELKLLLSKARDKYETILTYSSPWMNYHKHGQFMKMKIFISIVLV